MVKFRVGLAPVLAGDDGAQRRRGQQGLDELDPVFRQHGNTVLPAHAQPLQCVAEPVDAGLKFAVAHAPAVMHQRDAIRIGHGSLANGGIDCQLRSCQWQKIWCNGW